MIGQIKCRNVVIKIMIHMSWTPFEVVSTNGVLHENAWTTLSKGIVAKRNFVAEPHDSRLLL